ncbi:hypothetical protein [Streptomyces sp. NPDC006640]|uniref:hypothetical protein n=1 Tax=unclassified Streptomyces TaxID=2593676 RepID=UPI0036BAFD21
MTEHTPQPWFWEAGSDSCPHGPEPEDENSPEWEAWAEQDSTFHTGSDQDVRICREAPAGEACAECSEDANEFVPWGACRLRPRALRRGSAPAEQTSEHRPVTALVGTEECLERECDEFFTDDGDEIPGKETCSHVKEQEVCEGCAPVGDLTPVVLWADCPHRTATGPAPAAEGAQR